MKRLENLPQIAARQLGGLEASPTILMKAKLEAAERSAPKTRMQRLRPVMALCTAVVVCAGAFYALKPANTADPAPLANVLDSHSAGVRAMPSQEPRVAADVPSGAISMSAGVKSNDGTLFAGLGSATFPLVSLGDATYRLLISPDGITEGMLGESMGTVSEFNIEPALGQGGVVSNAVARGQEIRAIAGMSGALVAAPVDGALRVFQRVSYAGIAITGSETLEDTLCAAKDAAWIEVSGLGRVDDPATVAHLMETLLEYADYQGTSLSGSGGMQIGLHNGLTLQLLTGEDTVSACGTWSCPDFFEAYQEAVN